MDNVALADEDSESMIPKYNSCPVSSLTLYVAQVVADARAFIEKFDMEDAALKQTMQDAMEGPREAKLMYMEMLLLRQFSRIDAEPDSTENAKDMKALITKHSIFLTSNDLNISASDLHPGLWKAAQEMCDSSS